MCERATHVVVLTTARLNKFLELGHNLFPTALACVVHAETVVNFLSAVQTQNNVAHFPVGKVDNVVINKHAVGCQSKAEVFALFLFDGACVSNKLLNNFKVHKWLATKEVHFQIGATVGVFHKKIQRAFAYFKTHKRPFAVVLALACKTVGTVEVACVRNVQTKRLYNAGGFLFEVARHWLEGIGCKQLAFVSKFANLVVALGYFVQSNAQRLVFCKNRLYNILLGVTLVHGNDVVGNFVHNVNSARANVQNDIVAVQLKLVNHSISLSCSSILCQSNASATCFATC